MNIRHAVKIFPPRQFVRTDFLLLLGFNVLAPVLLLMSFLCFDYIGMPLIGSLICDAMVSCHAQHGVSLLAQVAFHILALLSRKHTTDSGIITVSFITAVQKKTLTSEEPLGLNSKACSKAGFWEEKTKTYMIS